MRKAMLLLTVFAFAGSLWAADPIIGSWKLNIAKSKFARAPKEYTELYREIDGNLIELSTMRIRSDGSSNTEKIVFPAQGGFIEVLTTIEKGRQEIETLIAPGEWYMTRMQNGKQIMRIHKVISKDGKAMHQTVVWVDTKGNIIEEQYVLDRQ